MVIPLQEVQKIVKNLSERELNNPEGMGVDLRIGSLHAITGGEAYVYSDGPDGQGVRSGFETEEVVSYKKDVDEQIKFVIKPGDYYLLKTIETVDTPIDVMGDFRPRSTLFRAGLTLFTSFGTPGYKGELIFGLVNLGPKSVTLQMGARVCSAVFYRLEEQGIAYRGQNQGGRITASGTEKQV